MQGLTLSLLDQRVGLTCDDPKVVKLVEAAYGRMAAAEEPGELRFEIESAGRSSSDGHSLVARWAGDRSFRAADVGEFLVELEVALTIELQRRRPDLYFVHSAVLEKDGSAIMLAGQPGAGKSTTCWALLHRGFGYLSDELGPVDLDSGLVYPYSRGIVLKEDPPTPFDVPESALRTSRTIHIPVKLLPAAAVGRPTPLSAIVFLDYRGPGHEPSLTRVGAARAGAILYTHALNALAHPGEGLDAAIRIAQGVRCFELVSSNLEQSCALLEGAWP